MTEEKNKELLLTTPPAITEHLELYVTGNEYISLPEIGPGLEIFSVNSLHMGSNGLLEFRGCDGKPLISPYISADGCQGMPAKLTWDYRLDWIPRFHGTLSNQISIAGEIAAPPGHRGCCCRVNLTNTSEKTLQVEAGWLVNWESFNRIIFNRKQINCEKTINYHEWTRSLILESSGGIPLAALALALEPGGVWQKRAGEEDSYLGTATFSLAPGETLPYTVYLAVNLESDGAGTTAVDLMRRGAEALLEETVCWLQERRHSVEDEKISAIMHRNLFFNYFYALGRALDTDTLIPVTSRSPRYYVSAAFWSRDTLLWSFPGLLLVDHAAARELLQIIFQRHLSKAGEHAHYINGMLLYPGFELDQLASHFLALQQYEHYSGDRSLPLTKVIAAGLTVLAAKAAEQRDPETGLYSTFLDPSDDPVIYPYLIYDNALLQRGFAYLARLQSENRWSHPDNFAVLAEELQHAIYRHGIVKGPRGAMFAWAVDGKGKFQLYDNPPGSLQLLAYYGFCSHNDSVFKNTVSWIRSRNNPYFHHGCEFEETGSLHCHNPWPLAACNDLLAFNAGGAEFLKKAAMDNGFCCETVDPDSGKAATGAAFASAAGFLAHALWYAAAKEEESLNENNNKKTD